MKKKKYIYIIFVSLIFTACDKAPVESEQYKKLVYIVGAQNVLQAIDLNYSDSPAETFVSISTSGSLRIDKDIAISLSSPENIISDYNMKYFEADQVDRFLHALKSDQYEIPNKEHLIIKANEEIYARQPIKIKTADLHPDSVYALPIRIEKISAYELNEKLNSIILTFNLKNNFSGNYGMTGSRKNAVTGAISILQKNKVLKAVAKNKLRMYISDFSELPINRETETVVLELMDNNTVKVSSWDKLLNVTGSGTYSPETKTITLSYSYQINGIQYELNEKLIFIN